MTSVVSTASSTAWLYCVCGPIGDSARQRLFASFAPLAVACSRSASDNAILNLRDVTVCSVVPAQRQRVLCLALRQAYRRARSVKGGCSPCSPAKARAARGSAPARGERGALTAAARACAALAGRDEGTAPQIEPRNCSLLCKFSSHGSDLRHRGAVHEAWTSGDIRVCAVC